MTDDLHVLSVARCASASYDTVDGYEMTFERAKAIYDKLSLSKPPHLSPFEHVAMADPRCWHRPHWGNFNRFAQLRHLKGFF